MEISSLFFTNGVSPPQPSAGSFKQKKKTYTRRNKVRLFVDAREKYVSDNEEHVRDVVLFACNVSFLKMEGNIVHL